MKLKNINFLFLTLIIVFASGIISCAPTTNQVEKEEAPRWVSEPGVKYPENQYLVARGQARTERAAVNNARAEIARIFQQQIETQEIISEEIRETFAADGSGEFQQEVSRQQQTVVEADEEILGLEIKEFYHDRKNNNHYALAVLARDEARSIYRDHFDRDNQRLENYFARATSGELNKVQQLQNLSRARAYAENAVKLQQHLKVIHPGQPTPRLAANPVDIDQKISKLLNELTIYVNPVEPEELLARQEINRRIEEWVKNSFADLDFQITSAEEEALLNVDITFNADYSDRRREDAIFIRWNINASLHDTTRATEIGSISHQAQSGGINEPQAKNRTLRDVESWIENNLSELIVKTLLTT